MLIYSKYEAVLLLLLLHTQLQSGVAFIISASASILIHHSHFFLWWWIGHKKNNNIKKFFLCCFAWWKGPSRVTQEVVNYVIELKCPRGGFYFIIKRRWVSRGWLFGNGMVYFVQNNKYYQFNASLNRFILLLGDVGRKPCLRVYKSNIS